MFVYFRDFHDFFKIELEVSLTYVKNLRSPLVVFFEKKNGVSRKKKFFITELRLRVTQKKKK